MKKTVLIVVLGLLTTSQWVAASEAAPEPLKYAEHSDQTPGDEYDDGKYWGWTPSATATFTSNYIWRGISQTSNGPAIQGSFDLSHDMGFYAGVWASNVQFDNDPFSANSLEFDVYGGFSRETDFGGHLPFSFTYDIGWLSYIYPMDSDAANFSEIYFGFGFKPVDKLNFSAYWYQDIGVGNKLANGYLDLKADYTLPDWAWGIKLIGHAGYYNDFNGHAGNFDDENRNADYFDWKFGIARNLAGFDVELAYTDTNGSERNDRNQPYEIDKAHFVVSVSRTLGDPIRSAPLSDEITASASAAITSDYIWRGVSQTSNGPAIQGSFDLAHELGFYVGAWGSNVEFDGGSSNSLELDVYGGFSRDTDFAGHLPFSFNYDIGWLAYIYPEDSDSSNFNEVYFGLGVSPVDQLNLSTYYYQDVGINNKFANGYLDMSADYTLPSWAWETQIIAHGGRYFKGDRGRSYWDWKAGLAKDLGPFNIEVVYTDTSGASEDGDRNLDDARAVGTISTTF